jgi:GNAT superfamily N-acetyltransferase
MTPGFLLRPARPEDLPAIVRLYAGDPLGAGRERAETPLPAAYLIAFQEIENDPHNELIVVETEGQIVGTLQLTLISCLNRLGGKRALVEAVHVDARFRGHGIGMAMMEWVIERARAEGCRLVQLTTDTRRPDAHRFYTRLGFVASHLGMKRDLTEEK